MRRTTRGFLAAGLVLMVSQGIAGALSHNAAADPTPPGAGEFVPIASVNLVTSASGVGWSGQIQPGSTQSVPVVALTGVPDSGVSAVLLHLATWGSASSAVDNGTLTVWPTGSARPTNATLSNAPAGSTADTSVFVQLGTGRQLSFFDGPNSQAVHVVANIEGYVTSSIDTSPGATFKTVTPSRIINTNNNTGGRSTPLSSSGGEWQFHVLGAPSVPASGVSAVALNVGAQNTSSNCWVQVQPTGTSVSSTSYPRTNTYAGYSAQSLAVVSPGTGGNISFTTNCSSVDVYVDVEGYYLAASNGSSGDVYSPITNPIRVVNTVTNVGVSGPMTPGRVISGDSAAIPVVGIDGVPVNADAVALSLRAINGTANGYNTVWTDGTSEPTATSSIDVDPSVTESNMIFVSAGASGAIDIAGHSSNGSESNDLYVDVEGYFYHPPVCVGDPANGECFSNTADGWSLTGQDQLAPWVDQVYSALGQDPNFADIRLDVANMAVDVLYHGTLPTSFVSTVSDAAAAGVNIVQVPTAYGDGQLEAAANSLADGLDNAGLAWTSISLGDYSGLTVTSQVLPNDSSYTYNSASDVGSTVQSVGQQTIPGIPVSSQIGDPDTPTTASRMDDQPAYKGGARIYEIIPNSNAVGVCTTGFSVASTTFDYYMLTDAHCANWTNGHSFETPHPNSYGSPNTGTPTFLSNHLDTTLIPVDSSIADVYTGNWNSSTYTPIQGVRFFGENADVCSSGDSSGIHCDLIRTKAGATITNTCDNPLVASTCHRVWKFEIHPTGVQTQMTVAGGDSGGPVYWLTNTGKRYGVAEIDSGRRSVKCVGLNPDVSSGDIADHKCFATLFATPLTRIESVLKGWNEHISSLS